MAPEWSTELPITFKYDPKAAVILQDAIRRLSDQEIEYIWSKLMDIHPQYDTSYINGKLKDVLVDMVIMDYEDVAAVFKYGIKKGMLPGSTSGDYHIPDWARFQPATTANTTISALAPAVSTTEKASASPIDLTSPVDPSNSPIDLTSPADASNSFIDLTSPGNDGSGEQDSPASTSPPALTRAASASEEVSPASIIDLTSAKDDGSRKQDDFSQMGHAQG